MANFNDKVNYNSKELYNSGVAYVIKVFSEDIGMEDDFYIPQEIINFAEVINASDDTDFAVTDFYVDSRNRIIPLGLVINYAETDLPLMPEAIDTTINLAGVDGDLIVDTVYGSMLFDIVAVTQDGLSAKEKQEIINNVKNKLNQIKNKTKHLSFSSASRMYDIKYTGLAEDVNYPGWVKFSIPLKSASPYAKDIFSNKQFGKGKFESITDVPSGFVCTISNIIGAFTMTFNNIPMSLSENAAITNDEQVIINTNNSTIKAIKADGTTRNLMQYYNKQFPKVISGINEVSSITGALDENVKIEWYNLYV